MTDSHQPVVIGLREWIALPDLGVVALRAKIDTGANTSALHASDIQPFLRDGERWVRFTLHLGTARHARHLSREAPVVTMRTIRSSNGHSQHRYVIRTPLVLGQHGWPVEFTLTCRRTMRYRVLLGARALVEGGLLVDPAGRYLQNHPGLPGPISLAGV